MDDKLMDSLAQGVKDADMTELISFKFKYINEDGNALGFRSKQGVVNESGIILGDDILNFESVQETTVRDKRLIIIGTNGKPTVIEVSNVKARDIERVIDRYSSKVFAQIHQQQLTDEGKETEFRICSCPACSSTVDVSGTEKSSYAYCRYCESLFTEEGKLITHGEAYRPCDECGMFDRVRGYHEFYFYFLVVIAGYSSKRRFLCDHCAHNLFLKMLLVNFIFVIGVPVAIYNKVISVRGRDPYLQQLAKANSLARQGNYQQAGEIYKSLHEKYPNHPALLLNEAKGYLVGGDGKKAMDLLARSLESTPTYAPSHYFIHHIQQMMAASYR